MHNYVFLAPFVDVLSLLGLLFILYSLFTRNDDYTIIGNFSTTVGGG